MNASRRRFIFAGALGLAAFAVLRYWPRTATEDRPAQRMLDADGTALIGAIVPVMLAGALPSDTALRERAIQATVDNVDRAIAGLAPTQIGELRHLFVLLALPPVRWSLTHSLRDWDNAAPADVDAFLARLRDSRIRLLRAAYDALHQLVFGAWYGNPDAWPAIGYPGPPPIE